MSENISKVSTPTENIEEQAYNNNTEQEHMPNVADADAQVDAIINDAASAVPEKPNSFIHVESFSNFVKNGLCMEEPKVLFPHVIVEHETTILFGDTGLGKTTFAMQMAIDMAEQGNIVLYVNFELSRYQVAKRFTMKHIPENLLIATIDYSLMHDVTDQSQILSEIEQTALNCQATVIIIDNLTNLCINSKDGADAGNIMLQLISLRQTHQWTMVVLAHVPKRKPGDPLTLNDLAGSKILSNMADNVVGINKSKLDKDMRYLIQLKMRSQSIVLDYKHVQEMMMTTTDGYLHFEMGGFSEERNHLPRSRDEKAELEQDIVKELSEFNGLSYREIADKLGTSLSTVQRVAKSHGLSRKDKEKTDGK